MTPARSPADEHDLGAADTRQRFARDVALGLTGRPKQLPPRYLYDALGSALFNAICQLPWYGVTRAETALIGAHGTAILSAFGGFARIVELGAGNGSKLATLVAARPRGGPGLHVDLVDVSSSALALAARGVSACPGVTVACHQATYEDGIDRLAPAATQAAGRTLVLFLGSNIGNFDPASADALLARIRRGLRPGDALLLGVDLVKPEADLLLAYDDPLGVTAAFNLNLLVRMNRELGADFDLSRFAHRARWDAGRSRVEMHLVSAGAQMVRIPHAGVEVAMQAGETIWTESSYKYRCDDVARVLAGAGFAADAQWVDPEAGFALTLALAGDGTPAR